MSITATSSRWHTKVQYRWTCDECGDVRLCAVIHRGNSKTTLRLCQTCYADGHWRRRP